MSTLIELSVELLEVLEEKGYNSVIHIKEKHFDKEVAANAKTYYVLKPSIKIVAEDTEINGKFYSPILSDDIRDMAKNGTPFIAFLLEVDDDVYSDLK